MAWTKDIEGNLVNLERCGAIRAVKVSNSDVWKILAYSEGNDQYPFAVLREVNSKREIDISLAIICDLVNPEKIELGTVN